MNAKPNPKTNRLVIPLLISLLALLTMLVLLSHAFGQGEGRTMKRAPSFSLKDTSGNTIKLEDFAGKTLVVSFVVTSDQPSLKQIAILSDWLKDHDSKEVAVLGMAIEQWGKPTTKTFVDQERPTFPFLAADYDTIHAFGRLTAVPTTYIIDKDQNIVQRYIGVTEKKVLETNFGPAPPR
jgi:peroxiredoxin